jgi:hypothetical protein
MPIGKLLDFDVTVEADTGTYQTRVINSPAGEAREKFDIPFTSVDLENFVLKVERAISLGRRTTRRIETSERQMLEDFGSRLFKGVFSGSVRECLTLSREAAYRKGAGLRIRLRLAGDLVNIPWEYLYDEGQGGFIALSPETVLVRYVELRQPARPFPVDPPLRILVMVSAPIDVPPLSGAQEWGKINLALADLAGRGMVRADRTDAGTLAALQRPLRTSEYHVLHFIGHGLYHEDSQDGALALEGAGGRTRLATGRDLGVMLRGHQSLRLVVLNACEGARSASDDPFGGVAQALVQQGIAAVIAMQFPISDPAAVTFTRAFYEAVADGQAVDIAMVEARRSIFAEGNEIEWATPVLYLRAPDGRVFARRRVSKDRQGADDLRGTQDDHTGDPGPASGTDERQSQQPSTSWPELEALPASAESGLRSLDGLHDTKIFFVNAHGAPVLVYWIDYTGERVLYQKLPPGARYVQPTYVTHPWVITTAAGNGLIVIQPAAEPGRVTIP